MRVWGDRPGRRATLLAAALAIVALTTACADLRPDPPRAEFVHLDGTVTHDTSHATDAGDAPSPEDYIATTQPDGQPTHLVIPAIDVAAPLVPVGLDAAGDVQLPAFGLAGWYTEGPRPGHSGPAVIAAHRDTPDGADVFFPLARLTAGHLAHVLYDSGQRAVFAVTDGPYQNPKDRLPHGHIWPDTDQPMLTLITCGGTFDRSARSYRDNIIVFARDTHRPTDG